MKYVTALATRLWGIYCWLVFIIGVVFSLIVVTVMPGSGLRQRLTTFAARSIFWLAGIPLTINGRDRLPDGDGVVVANHASYVDGFLMKAILPSRYSFVIKGEMRKVPVVHFLLRRAGSRFVDRYSAAGSTRDAREIVKAARGGQSLALFPEGTFSETVGIAAFRPGAFAAACKGGLPVVPAAIRGTRAMLPAGRVLPHWRRIEVDFLDAIQPDDELFSDHRRLAVEVRRRIVAAAGEPDLLENSND